MHTKSPAFWTFGWKLCPSKLLTRSHAYRTTHIILISHSVFPHIVSITIFNSVHDFPAWLSERHNRNAIQPITMRYGDCNYLTFVPSLSAAINIFGRHYDCVAIVNYNLMKMINVLQTNRTAFRWAPKIND